MTDPSAPTTASRNVLAVVGSSSFASDKALGHVSNIINTILDVDRPAKVITTWGGGVPAIAEQAARIRGIPFQSFEPSAHRWPGPGGQQTTLHRLVDACTRMVFICCSVYGITYQGTYAPRLAGKRRLWVEPFYIDRAGHVSRTTPAKVKSLPALSLPAGTPEPAPPPPPPPAPAAPELVRESVCTNPNCKIPFTQDDPTHPVLYCSSRCFREHTGVVRHPPAPAPSSVAALARVTSTCAWCHRQFDQPPEAVAAGKPHRWCSAECFHDHREHTVGPTRTCGSCAAPGATVTDKTMGLQLCDRCRTVAWLSCWRKRTYPSSFEAMQWARRHREEGMKNEQSTYRCRLCGDWHLTSWEPTDVPDDEFESRIIQVATLIEDTGFDLAAARGFTILPDGTHQPYQEARACR